MQLRATSGKSKSTIQKLVMTVNFYQTVNMSSKSILLYQNNLSIKKMKIIKGVYNVAVPETSKIIIVHQGCKSRPQIAHQACLGY